MYESTHSITTNSKAATAEQLLLSEERLKQDLPSDAFEVLRILHTRTPGVLFRPSQLIAAYPEDMPAPTRNVHFRHAKRVINGHPLSEGSLIQHGTRGGTKYTLARYVIEPILPDRVPTEETEAIFELPVSRPSRFEGVYPKTMYDKHSLVGMVVLNELLKKRDSEHKKIFLLLPLAAILEPEIQASQILNIVKTLSKDPYLAGAITVDEANARASVQHDAANEIYAQLPNYGRAILRAVYMHTEGLAVVDAVNYAYASRLASDPTDKQYYFNAVRLLRERFSHHVSLRQKTIASGAKVPWVSLKTLDERLSEKVAEAHRESLEDGD